MKWYSYVIAALSAVLIVCIGVILYLEFANKHAAEADIFDAKAVAVSLGTPVSSTVKTAVEGTKTIYEVEAATLAVKEQARLDALKAEYGADRDAVKIGQKFGVLTVDNTSIDCGLYWGDDGAQLDLGAAVHSNDGAALPGGGRTVLIGGHTGTFFSTLSGAQIGDIIHLSTGFGEYTYEIYDMQIIEEHDIAACKFDAEEESCILYTCYPFGILQHTPYRWFVYARPV